MEFKEAVLKYANRKLHEVNCPSNIHMVRPMKEIPNENEGKDCDSQEIDADEGFDSTDENGYSFTSKGPAKYMGDILENPDLLWTGIY